MDVEDDLKNLEIKENELSEEDELKRLKRRKIIIGVIGIFLTFLVMSYLLPGNYIFSIIEGKLVSSTLNSDFTVDLNNGSKVVFDEQVYGELKGLYFANQKTEFKVCLIGEKDGKDYLVSNLTLPKTISQSFSQVTAELCKKDAIISLHTHPYEHCIFSAQDIKSYDAVRTVNPNAIIGLMCGPDRFSFYGY